MSLKGFKDYIECNVKYYKSGNGSKWQHESKKYNKTIKVVFWSIIEYISFCLNELKERGK